MSIAAMALAAPVAVSTAVSVGKGIKAAAEKCQEVAKEFEATLLSELLKQMRNTLEPGAMFGKSGGDAYGGLFDFFVGKHLANAGGIGIARYVANELQQPQSKTTTDLQK